MVKSHQLYGLKRSVNPGILVQRCPGVYLEVNQFIHLPSGNLLWKIRQFDVPSELNLHQSAQSATRISWGHGDFMGTSQFQMRQIHGSAQEYWRLLATHQHFLTKIRRWKAAAKAAATSYQIATYKISKHFPDPLEASYIERPDPTMSTLR